MGIFVTSSQTHFFLSNIKLSRSVVSDSVTPWPLAHQAPPSMGFSRQEYWSGLPFPPPLVTLGTVLDITDHIMTKTNKKKKLYSNWEISVHISCFKYFLAVKIWFYGGNSRLGLQTSNLNSGARQLLDFVVVQSLSRVQLSVPHVL